MKFITKLKIEYCILLDIRHQFRLRGLCKSIQYTIICSKLIWSKGKVAYEQKHKMNLEFLRTNFKLAKVFPESQSISSSAYKIWVFWWQGKERMPDIVKATYNSIVSNGGKEVILITQDNYKKYVDIPSFIEDKVARGIIHLPHFSDYVRCLLLNQHGGMWIDSTVLMARVPPKEIFEYELFTVRSNIMASPLEGKYVAAGRWNMQILGTNQIHHPFFYKLSIFLMEYWKKYDCLIDYLLFDYVVLCLYEMDSKIRNDIDNIDVAILICTVYCLFLVNPMMR